HHEVAVIQHGEADRSVMGNGADDLESEGRPEGQAGLDLIDRDDGGDLFYRLSGSVRDVQCASR
ncbi:MAG: hypothetical protein ACPHQP_10025, partial [Longimicrobiales bacterium]